MNKRHFWIILAVTAYVLTACSSASKGPGGPGTISLQFKKNYSEEKVAKDLEVKKAFVTTGWINVPEAPGDKAIRYYLDLTDFDYDPQTSSFKPKADNQMSVEIDFFAEKGALEGAAIKPGTYQLANRSERPWNSYGKINNVVAYTFQNGKTDEYSLAYNAKGTLKINSVSADAVTGEIDLTQENGGSIKGTFTAKPFQVK